MVRQQEQELQKPEERGCDRQVCETGGASVSGVEYARERVMLDEAGKVHGVRAQHLGHYKLLPGPWLLC